MLEYPEIHMLATQLKKEVTGCRIKAVLPPSKLHKFCWFQGDPMEYEAKLLGHTIIDAEGFGIFAALKFNDGLELCVNDGVHVQLLSYGKLPKNYQLVIILEDERCLVFTVSMYGGIILHEGNYDNEYYKKSRQAIDLLSEQFPTYYQDVINSSSPKLSMKALLATEQRFPGIGNGCVQDILYMARLHPKRKLATLTKTDQEHLFHTIQQVLFEMLEKGGRDTEKDIYGTSGGYVTKMSKLTLLKNCQVCGNTIVKETYMGGSIYYCPHCQPLIK